MPHTPAPRLIRAILYGGGSTLLILDTFFLIKAVFTDNYVPIVPVLAGIFTAGGLLLIVHAEQRAREEDKRDHRRIARVAHQLTNPIKTLRDDLNHILKNADKLPAELRYKIRRMETKSNILLDNVRDVFLGLQAQEGPIAQEVRVYNLCTILEEAYQRAKPLASAHNVELIFKTHCHHAKVRVDKRLLLIAIGHIIENAILYTLTPGLVNVAVTKGKNKTRIIVQDRGIRISKADSPIVFRPFARGQSAEKYDADGIGVGLALSKLIMKEFDGKIIWIRKPHGTGTQFEIHLPLYKQN